MTLNKATIYDGTEINFKIYGELQHTYFKDSMSDILKEIMADRFIILLDSLTEDRMVFVKNMQNKVDVLTFKELYDKMIKGDEFYTLGLELIKGKEIAEWTKIRSIGRRYVSNHEIYKINQKHGETQVTKQHSLLQIEDNNIKKITPDDFLNNEKWFLYPKKIKHNNRTYGDFIDKARFYGAYLSEGCLSRHKRKCGKYFCYNNQIIISGKDKQWLEKIRSSFYNLFGKKGSYSRSGDVYNLVFYGEELITEFEKKLGKGFKNKKIPSEVYNWASKYQMEFLKVLIEGDGHFYKTTNKHTLYKRISKFGYTSSSHKLIAGVSFLLRLNNIHHTIHYRKEKDSYSIFSSVATKSKVGTTKVEDKKYTGYIYDITTDNSTFCDAIGLVGVHNTFMLHGANGWFLNIDTSPARTLFWFPTDGGGGLPSGCQNILKKIDKPVAMSKFGQKQVKEYHDLNVDHIPHGLDTKLFYKMSDEERLKLRRKYGLEGKFVIGVVARNQPRKHLDRTLKAMRLVADKIPNAVLFFHLDADDPAQPLWKIRSLIMKFGLENRCIFSGMKAHIGIKDKDMKNIYNVMDCFFLSTSGEGFGVPIIEALACEVPVVATSYTTTPELVEKHKAGFGIRLSGVEKIDFFELHSKEYDFKTMNGVITGSWEVERGIIDINDAADKIIQLYNDPKLIQVMGQNGRKAVMENYDFETKVGPAWEKLLK